MSTSKYAFKGEHNKKAERRILLEVHETLLSFVNSIHYLAHRVDRERRYKSHDTP